MVIAEWLVLTDIALSHYTTKILQCLKESRLATIVSITKGAKIVVSKTRTCATTQPRKAVSEMARYIDADAVEKRIVDYYDAQLQSYPSSKDNKEKERLLGGINYGRNVVRDAPTADVVPRSEVERLESELETLRGAKYIYATVDYCADDLQKALKENERLTVELEAMRGAANSYKMHYENLAREIFAEIEEALILSKCYGDSSVYFERNIETDIAELKKKYTEGNT